MNRRSTTRTAQGHLSEFDIIGRYFSSIGKSAISDNAIALAGGDDCALLELSAGHRMAISIDTLVAGRHFPENALPIDVGRRVLAVAVSDLAAMAATPLAFTLALTLPEFDAEWLEQFSCGLHESACDYHIPLIGGDTTRGPLTLSVQVHGTVPIGSELRRSGARVGDSVFVSGSLGDGAMALDVIQQELDVGGSAAYFYRRFFQPQARVRLGEGLRSVANSAIDISDGLLADVEHIAVASGVGINIFAGAIPFSPQLTTLIERNIIDKPTALRYALTGGDDYELCFSAPSQYAGELKALSASLDVKITEIGEVVAGAGVECLDEMGETIRYDNLGYRHF